MNKANIGAVLKDGRNLHSDNLSLKHLTLKEEVKKQKGLYSFVVSAKVAKLAVVRNLLKRRGRHIIRKISDRIKIPSAGMFFFKPGSAKIDFTTLEKEILNLLTKAGII